MFAPHMLAPHMLDRDAIIRLIPHQGRMCLLSSVESCTPTAIVCRAVSHTDPDNPLRRNGMLAPVCGVEYGLQAMAVHGAMVDAAPQRPGYLTSLRDVRLGDGVADLASAGTPLTVRADLLHKDGTGFIYSFDISAASSGGGALLSGQAMIIIPPVSEEHP
jgi:predicted hotdog family 3-hydroxylacyl-ACP dehydratase